MIKLIKTNRNGIPDLVAISENKTIFIEVKKKGGVVSELQKYRIKELLDKNIFAFVAYCLQDVRDLLEK